MEQELYTLKEIAQQLELPESTLRKYRDTYPQFIPYVGSGRERKYRIEAIDVFKAIRDCRVERHLSWDDTEKKLMDRFPMNPDEMAKKAVVTEQEANVFLERVEEAVNRLRKQADRQEFVTSALAGEIGEMKKLVGNLGPMNEDVKVIRRASYSYNEVVQRQHKETEKLLMGMLDALATIQGAIGYIPRDLEKMIGRAVPAAAPAEPIRVKSPLSIEPDGDPELVRSLREELVRKTAEADKFRELYVRAKREVDRLRAEAKKSALEGIYSQNAPDGGPAGDSESDAARGGKFFFRSKKKK
ncbi:MAG TPA: MerR family transcriptional regulator [bacterium]|nr:MerR family transcriptional regulator [bacterium]